MNELQGLIIEFIKSAGTPISMKMAAIAFEDDYDVDEIGVELRDLVSTKVLDRKSDTGAILYSLAVKQVKTDTLDNQVKDDEPKKTEEIVLKEKTENISNEVTLNYKNIMTKIEGMYDKINNPSIVGESEYKIKILNALADEINDRHEMSDSVSLALDAIAKDYDIFGEN